MERRVAGGRARTEPRDSGSGRGHPPWFGQAQKRRRAPPFPMGLAGGRSLEKILLPTTGCGITLYWARRRTMRSA
jgi:hypothetical protein